MPTRAISLFPEDDAFIQRLVESGRYDSASDVVLHALSLLEDHEVARAHKLARLAEKIEEGLEDVRAGRVVDAAEVFRELDEIIARSEAAREDAE
jgi:antitoxin ParD1/3/4